MPCFRLLGNSRFMRSALPALTLVACALLPQAALAGARFEVPDYLLRLPEQTYRLIEHNFSTLYQQTDFTPQITNSYFNHSDLYRFAGIPLAITPQNGFQMEVFGQLYNKSSQIYAQMSQDLSLYRTLRVDMMGDQSDEIAIGMAADPDPTPAERLLQTEEEIVATDIISSLPEDSREAMSRSMSRS
mgnify:CR=1 FL=1